MLYSTLQALTDFLVSVEPMMSRQLERNNRSHAFDGKEIDNLAYCLLGWGEPRDH